MMKIMEMLKLMGIFIMLTGQASGGAIDTVDVCECEGVCVLRRGARLVVSDCQGGAVRTTGPGFVTWVEAEVLEKFQSVVIERSTLSCSNMPEVEGGLSSKTLIVDGVLCGDMGSTTSTTTTTTKMRPTKETKPRPPAKPVNDDGDDDDDDDDYDDDDENDDDAPTTTTTSTNGSSTITSTTVSTTIHMMTFVPLATFTASFRDWIVVIGVGFLATVTGVGIIVRVCIYYRRRRTAPIQVNEVSSTEEEQHQQRTYVMRAVPRSPRRRGATDSMESVVLFAVDDSEL